MIVKLVKRGGGNGMVGLDLLPGLYEVSDRSESGGIGHAPITRGELYDFDDESLGRHIKEL